MTCCTEPMPKAYVIVDMNVTDPEKYKGYVALAGPSVEAGGGRFIVRGGATEVLEGDRQPNRTVILEFPDMDAARSWYNSPALHRGSGCPRRRRRRLLHRRRGRLTGIAMGGPLPTSSGGRRSRNWRSSSRS